jgi:hypothetical protein
MSDETVHGQPDIEALERFVVENDDLTELEALIGRFNIFDALKIARAEIRHSNFLGWLLDPNESHGQGSLFLKALLMDLLKDAPADLRPLSPVELDGEELRGVEIRREWQNIDLLIICEQPRFLVAIENKIDTGEHDNQLQRYKATLAQAFPSTKSLFVFLTEDGSEPSDDDWVPYTYADLYRVLDRCRRLNAGAIGGDILVFLDHYLRLIGSRFMNDEKIDALCQRIYRNHRQALTLIFERVGSPVAGLVGQTEELLRSQGNRWHVFNKRSKAVDFVPKPWLNLLPPIGRRKGFDPHLWLVMTVDAGGNRCRLITSVWPTTDPKLRRKVIERLTVDRKEFGFKHARGDFRDEWTFFGEEICRWPEDDEPDSQAVLSEVAKKLDELWGRLEGVPAALRPILESKR